MSINESPVCDEEGGAQWRWGYEEAPAGLWFTGILDLEEQEKTGPQRTGIENDTPELCSVPNTADQSASLGASVSGGRVAASRGDSDPALEFQAIQVSGWGW